MGDENTINNIETKEENLIKYELVEENFNLKLSKAYVIIHFLLIFIFSSLMMFMECYVTFKSIHSTQFVDTINSINVAIGVFFVFISFLSLFTGKSKKYFELV